MGCTKLSKQPTPPSMFTARFGCSIYPLEETILDGMLIRADHAMYSSKTAKKQVGQMHE